MPENIDKRKMGFITHGVIFLIVVVLLAVINTMTWRALQWWAIVGLCWGIGVAAHFAVVYLPLTVKKQSLGPVDIVGISVGSIAVLVAILSIGIVGRQRPVDAPWGQAFGGLTESFPWGERLREEKDQSVEGAFREVEVRSVSGSIDITGGSAGGVQVHSIKTAGSQRAMDALSVEIDPQGDRCIVREKRDSVGLFNSGGISFAIKVPAGVTSIVVYTVSGSIGVSAVEPGIDQALKTVSGSIRTDLAHDLRADTTSGRIEFTSTGKVLEAHTISGSIHGNIQAVEEGAMVSLATVSGSVDLKAFAALDATLSLHSLSGSVSCAFPVTVATKKNNALEGRIGKGLVPIKIDTTSGSISISVNP